MTRAVIRVVVCKLRFKGAITCLSCLLRIAMMGVVALAAVAGCGGGWVIPEPQDPAIVRERRTAARQPLPPPEGDDIGTISPFAQSQSLSPVARLLAHDVRVRLDARTLGYPGSPGFDLIEVYIAALDADEYAAAREQYASPEAAAALFQPDTGANRDRFHRQAMGSAETLHFQPNSSSSLQIGRTSRFWSAAAEKNAVGLLLVANLPDGGNPIRLLSLERGAWPGRRVDLSLANTGWIILSSPRRTR